MRIDEINLSTLSGLIDHDWALKTFIRLTQIDAPSGQEGELAQEIINIVKEALRVACQVSFDECFRNFPDDYPGSCGNLFLDIPGSLPGSVLGFSAHMDRVEPGRNIRPVVTDEEVKSDGSTILAADDVSGIATILSMLHTIARQKIDHRPLQLIFTVSEERGVLGAKHLDASLLKAKTVISFDGHEPNDIVIGGCASQKFSLAIRGKPAHAGLHPEDGVNAIEIAARAISAIKDGGWLGRISKDGKEGVSNIGTLSGGTSTNTVPERVAVSGEARSFDERFLQEVVVAIKGHFSSAANTVKSSRGETGHVDHWKAELTYPSWKLADSSPVVRLSSKALVSLGMTPRLVTKMGGFDASNLNRHVSIAVLGTGAGNAHTLEETLDREQFQTSSAVALALALTSMETET
jgi:tripeptide aminopeptidase